MMILLFSIAITTVSAQTNYRKEMSKYNQPKYRRNRIRDRYQVQEDDLMKEPETVDEHYELINAFLDGFNSE